MQIENVNLSSIKWRNTKQSNHFNAQSITVDCDFLKQRQLYQGISGAPEPWVAQQVQKIFFSSWQQNPKIKISHVSQI
jgi:hypothetical protein